MWSMGILVWEIFSNAARPYSHVANDGVTALVQAGKYPDIPKLAGEFMTKIMKQLFKLNPSERLNAQMFYNEIHTHCKDNKYLSLEKLTTINKIEGVHRDRLEHWDGYVPQVVVYDKNGKEKDWEDAPAEMLANVVWREKAT
ncbi:hypothetical protein L5515_004463 [Caenorhabditis briggsae]|uniref:Protein kinase domain-containing protein n=1 Tax=Caenorhabditis briggsae TaxID=6238 RepID=A0AAE9ELX7_CAEBR|nr:hypothetical protein L5515_004463 [Caenorhabditis briggsae]